MRGFETMLELEPLVTPEALRAAQVRRDALMEEGLPFDQPLAALGASRPEAYGLSTKEFVFDGLRVLRLPAARWTHRAFQVDVRWTQSFTARFWHGQDGPDSFQHVHERLCAALGPARVDTIRGELHATWPGLTRVDLRARIDPTPDRRNAYQTRNPELLRAARVEISSLLRTARPTPGIEARLAAATLLDLQAPAMRVHSHLLELHAHSVDLPPCAVWVDDDAVGVSVPRFSVVVPRTGPLYVLLLEIAHGRGRGSSGLAIRGTAREIQVAGSPDPRGLRTRAEGLAERLGLPLEVVETVAD
jgi:hypothetical protein